MSRLEYFRESPIAAISTATGGAIAMIRVSGKNLRQTLAPLCPEAFGSSLVDRHASLARICDPHTQTHLDNAVILPFFAPRSFTGEDVVEIHLHGGTYLCTRVMEVLQRLGIAQALPGEFSFRAVRNAKMSITQAQAISDLIAAQNDRAVAVALDNLSGVQNELLASIAADLRRALTLAEAGIDFSDQDIAEVELSGLMASLASPRAALRKLADSFHRGVRIQEGIHLAIVGLPNAGKSSLFNAILGEERSIVSEIAGTTRDTIRETLSLRNERSSLTFRLEDTAGLRAAEDHVEKMGVARTEKAVNSAEIVLWVVDPHQPYAPVADLWQKLDLKNKFVLGVFTKSDLVKPADKAAFFSLLPAGNWLETSAQTRAGLTELIDRVITAGESLSARAPSEVMLTRIEHFRAVEHALEALDRVAATTDHTTFSADLRQALHALSPLIGETPTDTILEKIFSEFCIGK